jgi:hypothetical protein
VLRELLSRIRRNAEAAKDKGASLAPWIKRWFDANIDRAGHNPQR